jgi:hypothetical protein
MAKLSSETTENINNLKQLSLEIVDEATSVELIIFEMFGETEQTLSFLDEMKNVADEAATLFSRLSTIQLQIAQIQPIPTSDMLGLLTQVIAKTQARIPALRRSIEEVKQEWNLL